MHELMLPLAPKYSATPNTKQIGLKAGLLFTILLLTLFTKGFSQCNKSKYVCSARQTLAYYSTPEQSAVALEAINAMYQLSWCQYIYIYTYVFLGANRRIACNNVALLKLKRILQAQQIGFTWCLWV